MTKRTISLLLVVLLAAAIVVAAALSPRRLQAQLLVEKADIGIPGVTKIYEAKLKNAGFWPVRIRRCDYIDDAHTPGKMVSFAVQRWDQHAQQWTTVVSETPSTFCKPYPLGILQSEAKSVWLWPGQSVSTGDEATAARNAFNVGDNARFVVFLANAGDFSSSIPTEEFLIDEHPTTDIPLRVRH